MESNRERRESVSGMAFACHRLDRPSVREDQWAAKAEMALTVSTVGSAARSRRPADQDGVRLPVPDRPAVQASHRGRRTDRTCRPTSTVNTRRRCGSGPSAARLYGDLQGIAGRSLPEIDGPDVPLPDGPAGVKLRNDGLARRLRNPACQQSGPPSPCWNSIHACFRRRQPPSIPRDRAHRLWSRSRAS
jgi:hypothetical protein